MGSINEHTVGAAARAAGLPVPHRFLPITGSTNDDLVAMAQAGAPEWTFLVAGYQERGRGRLGRTWVSPPGLSLHVSLLLRPDISPAEAPLLSMANAVCVAEACRAACGVAVRSKWPNDVVVGPRKIGGILPEASVVGGRIAWVVLGTGVNVGHLSEDFPEDLRASATSIALEGGLPDIPGLLREYLVHLRTAYEGSRFPSGFLAAYRSICDTIGATVRARTTGGAEVAGRATGIGEEGQLLVETDDGLREVAFGEVEHLG